MAKLRHDTDSSQTQLVRLWRETLVGQADRIEHNLPLFAGNPQVRTELANLVNGLRDTISENIDQGALFLLERQDTAEPFGG